MKAAQISDYGDASVIKVVDVDKPTVKEGQVLVEVHAASVNPWDSKVRSGSVQSFMPLDLPVTLGGDLSGVVAEAGNGFEAGDEVYGSGGAPGGSGSLAEFSAAPAASLAKKPAKIDFTEAAAIVLTGVSAAQAIIDHINLQSGQKILIHGGAGGIGSVAIQLAKDIGAHVTTTATGNGIDFVKGLGADEVIDYQSQKFEDVAKDYDAVFDTVSGETYTRSYPVLKRGGIIVSMIEQPNTELMEKYGVTAIAQQTKTTTEALERLAKLLDDGVVTVHVEKVFPLDQTQQAFEALESGQTRGKIAVSVK
jgi:NADPH:quinone reductase-like Zn-dependent oxidoreductase